MEKKHFSFINKNSDFINTYYRQYSVVCDILEYFLLFLGHGNTQCNTNFIFHTQKKKKPSAHPNYCFVKKDKVYVYS